MKKWVVFLCIVVVSMKIYADTPLGKIAIPPTLAGRIDDFVSIYADIGYTGAIRTNNVQNTVMPVGSYGISHERGQIITALYGLFSKSQTYTVSADVGSYLTAVTVHDSVVQKLVQNLQEKKSFTLGSVTLSIAGDIPNALKQSEIVCRLVDTDLGLDMVFGLERSPADLMSAIDEVYQNDEINKKAVQLYYRSNWVIRIYAGESIINPSTKAVSWHDAMIMATLLGDTEQVLLGIMNGKGRLAQLLQVMVPTQTLVSTSQSAIPSSTTIYIDQWQSLYMRSDKRQLLWTVLDKALRKGNSITGISDSYLSAVTVSATTVELLQNYMAKRPTLQVGDITLQVSTQNGISIYQLTHQKTGFTTSFSFEQPPLQMFDVIHSFYAQDTKTDKLVTQHYQKNMVLRLHALPFISQFWQNEVAWQDALLMAVVLGDRDQPLWGTPDGRGLLNDVVQDFKNQNTIQQAKPPVVNNSLGLVPLENFDEVSGA